MNQKIASLKFAWQQRKTHILSTIIILVVVTFFVLQFNALSLKMWSNYLDIIFGAGTLLIAFFIWLSGLKHYWEVDLPKRLTVKFMLHDQVVMECQQAYLAHEGDIRTWGQQIGAQMSGGARLQFQPYIEQKGPTI